MKVSAALIVVTVYCCGASSHFWDSLTFHPTVDTTNTGKRFLLPTPRDFSQRNLSNLRHAIFSKPFELDKLYITQISLWDVCVLFGNHFAWLFCHQEATWWPLERPLLSSWSTETTFIWCNWEFPEKSFIWAFLRMGNSLWYVTPTERSRYLYVSADNILCRWYCLHAASRIGSNNS